MKFMRLIYKSTIMDEIDVLCINCENLISLDQISAHSSDCITPIDYILNDPTSQIEIYNFRLEKLQSAITNSTKKPTYNENPLELSILNKYINTIKEIIKENKINFYTSSDYFKIIKDLELVLKDSIFLTTEVYLQRLKILIKEKSDQIKNFSEVFENKNTEKIEKNLNNKNLFSEINSQVAPSSRKSLSINSFESSSKFDDPYSINSPINIEEVNNAPVLSTDNDLRQYFYNKCLIMKLEYPSSHPVQEINVGELYQLSVIQQISYENWENFINACFQTYKNR